MSRYSIIRQVFELALPNIVRVSIILIGILLLPKTFWHILLTVLVVNTLFDLLVNDKPELGRLLRGHLITTAFLGGIFLLYRLGVLGGVAGTLGVGVLLIVFFAGLAIYNHWPLFDGVTTWGAKVLRGETKEEFNLKEYVKKK